MYLVHPRHTRATTDLGPISSNDMPTPLRMALAQYHASAAGTQAAAARANPPPPAATPASDSSSGDDDDDDDDDSDGAASPPMQRVDTAWNLDGAIGLSNKGASTQPPMPMANTPPVSMPVANTPPDMSINAPPAQLAPLAVQTVPPSLLEAAMAGGPELQPADDTDIETDSSSADDDDDDDDDVEEL